MALNKQSLNINFAEGLDTKTDPWQVGPGKFLSLQNSIFTKAGLLQKRNGFAPIATISDSTSITTFDGGLVALGNSLQAYSADTGLTTNTGAFQPLSLNTQSLVRSATSQTTVDVTIAPNGLACSVWLDSDANSYYQVSDSTTGQSVVAKTQLPATATMPRVFVLGQYIFITFMATVAAAAHLQYIAIPFVNPSSPSAATDIATSPSSITGAYDAVVASNTLYIAWNKSATLGITTVSSALVITTPLSIASNTADLISMAADTSSNSAIIWLTWYNASGSVIKTTAYNQALDSTPILGVTSVVTSITVNELTSTANSSSGASVLHAFYEVANTYSFNSVKSDYVSKNSCTIAGTPGSPAVVLRGVGLGSKAIRVEGDFTKSFMLVTYGQALQPTYFLIDDTGKVLSKLAYSNGGGYEINQILPQMMFSDNTLSVGYLYKDLLAAVNKTQGVVNVNGVYAQTGINLASLTLNSAVNTAEIGNNLHISGGFVWMYDGAKPVEHNFHVYPEDVGTVGINTAGSMIAQQYFYQAVYEWTDSQANIHRSAPSIPITFTINTAPANFTGNRTSGSPTLASVSSFTNLQVGQPISGTGIPAATYILALNSGASTLTMSANATSGSATSTTVTPTTLASLNINVPTLRLTYKTTNKVRIVLYRWSTAQQNYYRVTSISSPTINDPTVDFVTFTDSQSDAQILGNDLIYTTGGVVENIAAPGCSAFTLFKSRFFLVDAEDKNLLWFSKQVIETVPVELSDLFTLYIAPTTGAQGSTGPITALSAMDDKLIIFKKDAIYYLTGTGPDNTGLNNDFSDPIFITSTVGCANPDSIVFMPNGLMFQSDKGIWLLGRDLSTTYIGAAVEDFIDQNVTSAQSIPGTNEVRFTLDSDVVLMYDYYYSQWGTFVNVPAVSSTLYQGLHTYLNQYGQLMQETPGLYLDNTTPVQLSFKTSWINLANLQGYERIYDFYLLGNFISPHFLIVQTAYDYSPSASHQSIIMPNNYTGVFGSDSTFGLTTPFGGSGTLEQWRVHTQRQTCQSFQITVTEQFNPAFGTVAGAGLTLSGINCRVGIKKGARPIKAASSVG